MPLFPGSHLKPLALTFRVDTRAAQSSHRLPPRFFLSFVFPPPFSVHSSRTCLLGSFSERVFSHESNYVSILCSPLSLILPFFPAPSIVSILSDEFTMDLSPAFGPPSFEYNPFSLFPPSPLSGAQESPTQTPFRRYRTPPGHLTPLITPFSPFFPIREKRRIPLV